MNWLLACSGEPAWKADERLAEELMELACADPHGALRLADGFQDGLTRDYWLHSVTRDVHPGSELFCRAIENPKLVQRCLSINTRPHLQEHLAAHETGTGGCPAVPPWPDEGLCEPTEVALPELRGRPSEAHRDAIALCGREAAWNGCLHSPTAVSVDEQWVSVPRNEVLEACLDWVVPPDEAVVVWLEQDEPMLLRIAAD